MTRRSFFARTIGAIALAFGLKKAVAQPESSKDYAMRWARAIWNNRTEPLRGEFYWTGKPGNSRVEFREVEGGAYEIFAMPEKS